MEDCSFLVIFVAVADSCQFELLLLLRVCQLSAAFVFTLLDSQAHK